MNKKTGDKSLQRRRETEKELLTKMVVIYCKGNRHNPALYAPQKYQKNLFTTNTLCPECEKLRVYAVKQIDKCPFMETKTFCSNCKVHCYKADRREQVRSVMKYAGPRMLFHHPVLALKHMVHTSVKQFENHT
ncbi:hypothetical protein acsn021_36150 [Anaerocolumna cellulosilytica]|uniref:Uncharacterized protein n=1 Tax=Anaerocolumna cellulosilytica TaxID=433286 RepID=A0A6S6R1R8_9FIRM|nr:nitrous oxide-stimulated promoter family protein [Anaerocolumna cellulosilytica]MBB5195117.1 hypothetical protein [Anaerocolumna cellulosilytica]BCJ96046.1 hypothetical protein acsn021_36150 [Anaerocolumna cellulosilytica]